MRKIALIEDDPDLFDLLRHSLTDKGYDFVGAESGRDALDFLRRRRPDLLLLDIMLPEVDGIEICRSIRADSTLRSLPVIFLTARDGEADRVLGLEVGGDDYLVKPFSLRELHARIRIQLRSRSESEEVLRAGPIELNRARFTVTREGRPIPLTATEFRLLEHLMSYPGQVFRRDRLLDAVWGDRSDVMERTVDAYIVRLRGKIESEPSRPTWIRSTRGVGYSFRPREAEGRSH